MRKKEGKKRGKYGEKASRKHLMMSWKSQSEGVLWVFGSVSSERQGQKKHSHAFPDHS